MFHLCQRSNPRDSESITPVYRHLAGQGINLPCLGLARTETVSYVSCCLEQHWDDGAGTETRPVCIISVYPHGSKTAVLGRLLHLFAANDIGYFHMVSSTAMLSFVVAQADKDRTLDCLEQTFDLPPTHTPYEPGFQEETAAFVKQRYQETRAYFRERKIKTYGFALERGLNVAGISCTSRGLDKVGQMMERTNMAEDGTFCFATALAHPEDGTVSLYWLGRERTDVDSYRNDGLDPILDTADMVSFHGPHFGDRFGIFNAAAECLDSDGIDILLAGCTGASITLVLPAGAGEAAVRALEKGFDTP